MQEVVLRRDAPSANGEAADRFRRPAEGQASTAKSCFGSFGVSVKGRPGPVFGCKVHGDGVEARDVGDRIVDERVKGDGVGSAIRKGKEGVAGSVGKA